MKTYNFDEIIDRRHTGAVKTDALQNIFGKADLLPMWVADMDFRTPDFVLDAIRSKCEQGILGYTMPPSDYYASIISWLRKRHQWEVRSEWLEFVPGIVKGVAFSVSAFTRPGDKVIIQSPVYHPFRNVPLQLDREIVVNPLKETNGCYRMDLKQLESVITPECKLLILCNPHNPIGITWEEDELKELAEICAKNNILVISDEIHADMPLFGNKHLPFASVSETAKENCITFMAPSKTFNIAGIVSSFCIISNPEIREKFHHYLHARELNQMHIFAGITCQEAFSKGEDWLKQMLEYVEGNILFVKDYLQQHIPPIKAIIPQASFLIWLDCRELNLSQKELVSFFIDQAGLALNSGSSFGPEGEGFMRMNIGCPRETVRKAMKQLQQAYNSLKINNETIKKINT